MIFLIQPELIHRLINREEIVYARYLRIRFQIYNDLSNTDWSQLLPNTVLWALFHYYTAPILQ